MPKSGHADISKTPGAAAAVATDEHASVAAGEPAKYPARPHSFAILLLGLFCMGVGNTVMFAVLPPIGREIGLADFQVGAIFSISAAFWVLLGPFWGRCSDRFGRRPFVLLGIGGYVMSMLLLAGAVKINLAGAIVGPAGYMLVLATRCIYGIIGSAQPPAAQAYIADRTSTDKRAKGLAGVSAAFGFGAMMGPVVAGLTVNWGLLAPIYAVAMLGIIAFAGVFFFLPENNPPKERTVPPSIKLTDRRIVWLLLFGLAGSTIASMPVQILTFYFLDVLAFSNTQALARVSIALTASSAALLFSQIVMIGHFSLTPKTLISVGPLALIAGNILLVLGSNVPLLVIGMTLNGLAWGMMMPGFVAAASLAVSSEEQGAVSGLTGSAAASGFVLAPVLALSLYSIDPKGPFVFCLIASILVAFFVLRSDGIKAAKPTLNVD